MSLVLPDLRTPQSSPSVLLPCYTHTLGLYRNSFVIFFPHFFKARMNYRSKYGVLWKSGKTAFHRIALGACKSWCKGNVKATWPPLSPAVQIISLCVVCVHWSWDGEHGCLEECWILNHSSLRTYRLGQGTYLSLIIYFCCVPFRQIIYTYVILLVTSLSSSPISMSKKPFHPPVKNPHVASLSQVTLMMRNQAMFVSTSLSCFGISKY